MKKNLFFLLLLAGSCAFLACEKQEATSTGDLSEFASNTVQSPRTRSSGVDWELDIPSITVTGSSDWGGWDPWPYPWFWPWFPDSLYPGDYSGGNGGGGYPGGGNGGGGSSGGPPPTFTPSTQVTNMIDTIDLNSWELDVLNSTIALLLYPGCGFVDLYNYLGSRGHKIAGTYVNPNQEHQGMYDPRNKFISFQNIGAIGSHFPEEFVHFFQDMYYDDGISQYNAQNGLLNIEFEAKLFCDLFNVVRGAGGMYLAATDQNVYYIDWLLFVTNGCRTIPTFSTLETPVLINGRYYDYWECMKDFRTQHYYYNFPINPNLAPLIFDFVNNGKVC